MQLFENAARTGIGNCIEKASIGYSSLFSNPRLYNHSTVILCQCFTFDHIFILITGHELQDTQRICLGELSKMSVIVDCWMEDWYFPNLNSRFAFTNGLQNIPNLIQLRIRQRVMNQEFSVKSIPIFADPMYYPSNYDILCK